MKRKGNDQSLAEAEAGALVNLSATFNQKKYRLVEVSEDIIASVGSKLHFK